MLTLFDERDVPLTGAEVALDEKQDDQTTLLHYGRL